MTTDVIDDDYLDLDASFGSDIESEEDGIWADLNGKTKFKIRAFNAKAVIEKRDALLKPYQTMIRAGLKIPEKQEKDINLKIVAGAVLVDWDGVQISRVVKQEDGTEKIVKELVPYSEASAITLFEKLPKFADFIAKYSMNTENYRTELREDSAGN